MAVRDDKNAEDDRSSKNFSSANPPKAPSGLSSGLQPGGVIPAGGPAVSEGAIGTGGGQTPGDTGSKKTEGR